jgi:CDP-glucose 4,6-dehydratase
MSDSKPNSGAAISLKALDLSFWNGKSVFLTGHTGFKGSWLSLLLSSLGAKVHGYSLAPPTEPSLFVEAQVDTNIASSSIGDIRDRDGVLKAMRASDSEFVFHLAAQPMVLSSYEDPFETYDINVSGTVSVLDAARKVSSVKSIVVVTTDKCYENLEWEWPYRENDTLGGYDPYSNSKACCELVVQSFRKSFFQDVARDARIVGIASARAGNIIGGGDWGVYRLLPDFFRAYERKESLTVRNPDSVRPWQHVLEPLMGYLMLGQAVYHNPLGYSSGFNFGPDESLVKKVDDVLSALKAHARETVSVVYDRSEKKRHEAKLLRLDCSKAKSQLGWRPRLNFEESIKRTLDWYERWMAGESAQDIVREQIEGYLSLWR